MSTAALTTPRGARFRRHALFWGGVLLVAAIVVAVVWGTGGFDRGATPYRGPQVKPGDEISTRFRDVAVHDAAINEELGEILVRVTATNRQTEATAGLTPTMIIVRLPGDPSPVPQQLPSGTGILPTRHSGRRDLHPVLRGQRG